MADVVVVDDSQFMRVQIREILEQGDHRVIAEAGNGKEALEVVAEHDPDVVTMDVKMPGIDGIEAVERLMDAHPTPVLMLSRYTEEGAETTFEALDAGAVDFMMKPGGEVTTGLVQYADDLIDLVDVVARADIRANEATAVSSRTVETPEAPRLERRHWDIPPTLIIAASTGGPSEIQATLGSLPGTVGLRILVVQHMPAQFTDRFAKRLDEASPFTVREATERDRVGPNEALVARGDTHLEVERETGQELVLVSTDDPPVHSVRPAADVTLESAAGAVSGPLRALVISGMGRDGAAGVEEIANAGGEVLVQSPDSASIASMPENAIETGVVDEIAPIEELPEVILDSLE